MSKWEGPRLVLVLLALMVAVGGLVAADAAAPKALGPFAVAALGALIFLGRDGVGQIWQRSAPAATDRKRAQALGNAGARFAGLCGIAAFVVGVIGGITRIS